MTKFQQIIKRIDFRKVLLVAVLTFVFYNLSSFEVKNLQIESEKFNKRICISELKSSLPMLEAIN
jgi:hypothetical protein